MVSVTLNRRHSAGKEPTLMNAIQTQIQERTARFAGELGVLIHRNMLAALTQALVPSVVGRAKVATKSAPTVSPKQIVDFIGRAGPGGAKAEDISAHFGIASRYILRDRYLTDLLTAKVIRKTGQKRGTRYFVVK